MTTPIVKSITDDLLDELERSANYDLNNPKFQGDARVLVAGIASVIARLRAAEVLLAGAEEHARLLLDSKNQWSARARAAEADVGRLDKLDALCEPYGFEGIHEGNRWIIEGPYRNVRVAIDDIKPDAEVKP
jgi:hypothetical protein